jgi:hypothetical protein
MLEHIEKSINTKKGPIRAFFFAFGVKEFQSELSNSGRASNKSATKP